MARKRLSQSQAQTQTQTQNLSLSPLQVMVARLLELTTVEFEDRVRGEVIDNPALETVEPERSEIDSFEGDVSAHSADDYRSEDDVPDYNGWDYRDDSDDARGDILASDSLSFGDTLLEQLSELPLTPVERSIGEYIIGSLDDDGLLHKTLSEIADELLLYNSLDVTEQDVERLLVQVQAFEPAGIAARSLQECLLLQLERKECGRDLTLHKRIISEFYDDFTKKHWDTLPDKLSVSSQEFREAIADIVRLNPRPGAALAESVGMSRQQIIPDFNVDIQGEQISVSLNNNYVPELRVSEEYRNMLAEQGKNGDAEHRAAAQFLKQKIDSAKNFINAIKQRNETLLRTMEAIAVFQRPFFVSGGDEAMLRPMILDDIAKYTGYDISTISRVSNSKYAQLPWGICKLKYFFSDGVATADGGERSVRELCSVLQELVDAEDKSNPLTDTELTEKLSAQGFSLARRTVAKYREQLHIPVARLRKE